MGKAWKFAVVGLVGVAGWVVRSRRSSRRDEPVSAAVVRRREAPRRADARRGGRAAPVARRVRAQPPRR